MREDRGIADDDGLDRGAQRVVGQRLQHDLGADPGGIAERQSEARLGGSGHGGPAKSERQRRRGPRFARMPRRRQGVRRLDSARPGAN